MKPQPVRPLLKVVQQRHSSDCAVACLAMLLHLRYEDVLIAIGYPVIDVGMSVKEIKDTADKLGYTLRLRRAIRLDEDSGMLGVRHANGTEHVVILHEGLVIDTDGSIWDADDYLASEQSKATSLLVIAGRPTNDD